MKRTIVVAVVVFALVGVATAVWYVWIYPYNPYHNGKRVYAWADQATLDPDPAKRREATQNLIEAFRELKHEPRMQLLLHCCYTRYNDRGEYELPVEILPFLIETLHAHDIPVDETYPEIALSRVEDAAAVPALIEVIRHDEDAHARAGAICALGMMGAKAKAAEPDLRRALADPDEDVRKRARRALEEILEAK